MYYELYIDVFFLENFMMDALLLMLTGRMIRCQAGKGRIFFGAALGAFLTCAAVLIPVPYLLIRLILFYGGINLLMLKVCFQTGWDRTLLFAWIFLYVSGFLLGGALGMVRPYTGNQGLFFFLAFFFYLILSKIWDLLEARLQTEEYRCRVILRVKERKLETEALIDSGNRLREPGSGRPVHIIGRKAARVLWQDVPLRSLHYISYHSVGKEGGVMPLLEADRMEIHKKKGNKTQDIIIERPVVAVCDEEKVTEEYDMILNLNI